jgi:hypothetical protein
MVDLTGIIDQEDLDVMTKHSPARLLGLAGPPAPAGRVEGSGFRVESDALSLTLNSQPSTLLPEGASG